MDLSRSPGFLISKLANIMANHLERRLREHGITVSQWVILTLLKTRDGMAQVELQRQLYLDGATVAGIVKRMTRCGFVRRETDPTDKRIQRVYLTEQGRQLESVLVAEAESVNSHALQGFSEPEAVLLIDLLSRSLVNFQSGVITLPSEGED